MLLKPLGGWKFFFFILLFMYSGIQDPGWKKKLGRNLGSAMKKLGSGFGVNFPDPQHCLQGEARGWKQGCESGLIQFGSGSWNLTQSGSGYVSRSTMSVNPDTQQCFRRRIFSRLKNQQK
jgi:hypothetical protein